MSYMKIYLSKTRMIVIIIISLVVITLLSTISLKYPSISKNQTASVNKTQGITSEAIENIKINISQKKTSTDNFLTDEKLEIANYISPSPRPTVLANKITPSQPKPTITVSAVNRVLGTNTVNIIISSPTPIALSSVPAQTITPTPIQIFVNLQIESADGSSNFSIVFNEGMNVCDILQKAKDEGKIQSLTFDDSYLSAFNSRYIYEINGLKNNWTFTVNGKSPLGCSLITPAPNDTIKWKFG